MSNFYDLETDIEVEDVASEETEEAEEAGYTYERQEDELEDTEFGKYDPEEAAARWGGMEFDQLISEIEGYVARSKKYFFSKKRIVVDGKELNILVKHIQDRYPQELQKAIEILDRETIIINDATTKSNLIIANAKANEKETVESAKKFYVETCQKATEDKERLIAEGKAEAYRLVQEHEITKEARAEAERIKEANIAEISKRMSIAQDQINEYRDQVEAHCAEIKRKAVEFCDEYCNWVEKAMTAAYNFVMTNVNTSQKAQVEHLSNIEQFADDFCRQYQASFTDFLQRRTQAEEDTGYSK